MPYKIYSPAKLNLGLQVIGYKDNKHLLNTIFTKINWFDIIVLEITNNRKITPLGLWSQTWQYQDDLIYKAALSLQNYSQTKLGVSFSINKNIPIGAGLGGGSANAATTLYYLNILWKLFYPPSVLIDLAKLLGDDIAFFLYDYSCLYYNLKHYPLNLIKQYFIIIVPKQPINTEQLFAQFHEQQYHFQQPLSTAKLYKDKDNDLLPTAMVMNNNIKTIIDRAHKFGFNLFMTGSGSVLYLSYYNQELAKLHIKILAKILLGLYTSLKVVKSFEKIYIPCQLI